MSDVIRTEIFDPKNTDSRTYKFNYTMENNHSTPSVSVPRLPKPYVIVVK